MSYPLIKVPSFANKSFYDFSKVEGKEYMKWFLGIQNERLNILENNIRIIQNSWKADYSKGSLITLYSWFTNNVAFVKQNQSSLKEIQNQISITPEYSDIIPLPENSLSPETVSICFDAGLYLGETLIHNIQTLMWVQNLSSINYIDYAQPLIGEKGNKVSINPRRIAESIALRILENEPPVTFETIYEKWAVEFSN